MFSISCCISTPISENWNNFLRHVLNQPDSNIITNLNQQLKLLIIIKDPSFLPLNQVLSEHSRYSVFLNMQDVIVTTLHGNSGHLVFLYYQPTVCCWDFIYALLRYWYAFLKIYSHVPGFNSIILCGGNLKDASRGRAGLPVRSFSTSPGTR